jgi:large subunit ribosomal protein L4e
MKAILLDINGKEKSKIDLPKEFSTAIREDIVFKVLEAKKSQQPYAPSLVAGKQHAASGKIVHRRHVWRSGYGKGISRIPRKIMSRRGTQFNWVGAEVASTVGGRRAHPPKVISMKNTKRINKKEMVIAFMSALSATADEKSVISKYATLKDIKINNLPLIVESKISTLKTKDLILSIEKLLGKELFGVAIKKKSVRSGKGKLRGRKYKSNAGLLLVMGKDEKIKTNAFEVVNMNEVGVTDLAKGGLGRLTIYTEKAVEEIKNKFGAKKK